ncbi:PREDICTED: porphobilinogen deaminase-like [Trachymyrmex cornetzi]|uniref:porphobilinogen deaminase-like n=1 Tax=Trachymyrmex cornetzi TaxID=471704 RepID=UPI00084EE0AE|nr:PREDICTED: porphobilinogen deaminase-like [Trachymyrmex cornetzi]
MLLKVGTRASPLAIAQVKAVICKIQENFSDIKCEIVKIQTTGDRLYQADLHLLGGKGLFLKEREMQLISKEIDIAVHSMKDVPAIIPKELVIDCVLEREDPRDVFISLNVKSLEELHEGAVVGTCLSRRRAFLQKFYKQVKVQNIRGRELGVECRIDDSRVLKSINHAKTYCCVLAERTLMKAFGGLFNSNCCLC